MHRVLGGEGKLIFQELYIFIFIPEEDISDSHTEMRYLEKIIQCECVRVLESEEVDGYTSTYSRLYNNCKLYAFMNILFLWKI